MCLRMPLRYRGVSSVSSSVSGLESRGVDENHVKGLFKFEVTHWDFACGILLICVDVTQRVSMYLRGRYKPHTEPFNTWAQRKIEANCSKSFGTSSSPKSVAS